MTDIWTLAARRAGQLALAGPAGSRGHLHGVVESLREAARQAPTMVGEITGLEPAAQTPVYVVDRPRWAEANAQIFRILLDEIIPPGNRASDRAAGEEMGLLLALLSARVLGQFDPFSPEQRLLLVAPNIVAIERELDFDVQDFRQWVCLHEHTHAVQFAAAPWLAGHLASSVAVVGARIAERDATRWWGGLASVIDLLRHRPVGADALRVLLTADEREDVDRIIAVMSVLEGHADVVMDAVGPARLPSVRRIRASFERRRDGAGPFDLVVRRVLGLDAKIAQYRNGAAFVRAVVQRVGHAGLNAVWAAEANLPSPREIAEPERWVRRVHG